MPEKFLELIRDAERPLITGHKDPDGDCLGSIIALYEIMSAMGKKPRCIIEGPIPKRLAFLDKDKVIEDVSLSGSVVDKGEDIVFVCDCASMNRLGMAKDYLAGKRVVNIDHHVDNERFGDYNFIYPEKAAACELIADFVLDRLYIPFAAAIVLAAGILYDTGGLRHSNTSPDSLAILSRLQKIGVNISLLQAELFGQIPFNDFQKWVDCLKQTNLTASGKIAWVTMEDKDSSAEISQRVIEDLKSITGVEIAIVFKKYQDNITKVSLRSKNCFPVNRFAAKWGGGGHERAAGVEMHLPLLEAVNTIISQMVMEIDEWDN